MTPTKDHVFIQVDTPENKTAAGIYMVKTWDNLPPTGVVTAVGKDVEEIKVGDHVIFMQYASLDTNQADIRVVKEAHVVGVIND